MKVKLAFLSALASVGVHLYLTLHFYGLRLGLAVGDSICNLNSTFNCDAVTASQFAHTYGIPVALWGAIANLALAIMLFGWVLRWAEDLTRLSAFALILSSFIALVSVVMGVVSTFLLGTYCIFCIAVYILSFFQFEMIRRSQDPARKPLLDYLTAVFSISRVYLVIFLAIPATAFFAHKIYTVRYGASQLTHAIRDSMTVWTGNPVKEITVAPLIVKGSADAKFVIKEFADFRCGHCRHAATPISAFVNSRPDVRLEFHVFPLDGTCNEAMEGGGDGISCYLARAVYCAETTGKGGWALHDGIFAVQDAINGNHSLQFARETVERLASEHNVPVEALNTCIADTATDDFIRSQGRAGKEAGISGTPAFFVNGKLLPRAQLLSVMEAAYSASQKR